MGKETWTSITIQGRTDCTTGSSEEFGPYQQAIHHSFISDVGGKRTWRSKPVSHEKFNSNWNTGGYSYAVGVETCNCSNIAALALGKGYAIYPTVLFDFDWEGASGRAWRAMCPSLKSDLNLSVFLAEITQLKDLFKLWEKGAGFLKNIAKGHLNYSFGWAPTINDLKNIFTQALSWQARLDDLIKRQNTMQVRHYRESPEMPSGGTIYVPALSGAPKAQSKITTTWNSCLYTATLKYKYKLPQYSDLETKVRAFMDAFGAKVNLSTLWELVPFSFVVDWFAGVGDWLSSNEDDMLQPILHVEDFCHSLKLSYQTETSIKRADGAFASLQSSTSEKYYRRVGTPNMGSDDDGGSGFNPRRIALSASLLLANLKHR